MPPTRQPRLSNDEIRQRIRAQAASIQKAILEGDEKMRLTEANTILLSQLPFFSSLLLSECELVPTRDPRMWSDSGNVAATDGRNIYVNPESFLSHSLWERVFIVCHEVMHVVLNHVYDGYRYRVAGKIIYPDGIIYPYDDGLCNQAMDAVINAALIADKIGRAPADCVQWPGISPSMSWLDAYRAMYDEATENQNSGSGRGSGAPGGAPGNPPGNPQPVPRPGSLKGNSNDALLDPGTGSGQDPAVANLQAQARDGERLMNVRAAAEMARVQGNLPAGLQRIVDDAETPAIDWKDQLAATVARAVGGGGWDYSRGDRRFLARLPDPVYVPGRCGKRAGSIVVGIDTSGSIGNEELAKFFGVLRGIIEDANPEQIDVLWCDAAVQRHDQLEEGADVEELRKSASKGKIGGGGTAFEPVFDWVAERHLNVQSLVYLTDTYGSFPTNVPPYPTIWATIGRDADWKPPFGSHVPVEV